MTLGIFLTLVGLLIAAYTAFVKRQARLIKILVHPWPAGFLVFAFVVTAAAPHIVRIHDGAVPPQFTTTMQIISIACLVTLAAFVLVQVNRPKLGKRSASRLERTVHLAVQQEEWLLLQRILRENKSSIGGLVGDEGMRWLFDPRFVRAMTDAGDWIHLEILADQASAVRGRGWRPGAVKVVGRAMLDGEGTLLQKGLAAPFSAHETLRPAASERALLDSTYWNPRWYIGIRAGYPLMLRAIELLEGGQFDATYNNASWGYTARQGVTGRWKCPVWVAAKTIYLAIKAAIEADVSGDEYVSDLLHILRAVVGRSKYDQNAWSNRNAHGEFPTPFAYLMYEIFHDLADLWKTTVERGLFVPGRVEAANEIPRCPVVSKIWAMILWTVAREPRATAERFRVDMAKSFLDTVLQIRYSPYDVFYRETQAPQVVLDSLRDLLLNELIDFTAGDTRATDVICRAAGALDLGKGWVADGGPWLSSRLTQALQCS